MSLRDRLRVRPLPTATVALVADRARHDTAERELDAAGRVLAAAQARGEYYLDSERARVATAEQALSEVEVETLTVRALPPADWEALIEAHPPSAEQQTRGAQWNPAGFGPALLAVSVVPADGEDPLSEQEWRDLTTGGHLSAGELNLLIDAAITINGRVPVVTTGKGSRGTLS